MKRLSPAKVIRCMLGFSFLSISALGCTYFPPSYNVGPDFIVKVSGLDGSTFAGVRVVLIQGSAVNQAVLTNQAGDAHFAHVPSGEYSLEIDELGTAGWDTAFLRVANANESQIVQLHWPSDPIIETKDVQGTLLDSRTGKPFADAHLQLQNAIDGSLRARFTVEGTGEFDLGSPDPGLYFIKLDPERSGDWEPRGVIPVRVTSNAGKYLALAVGETSCGMKVSQLCDVPRFSVAYVMGTLVDTQGAIIDRARVDLLRSSSHSPVISAVPDPNGRFSFKEVAPGDYELRISAGGFAPVIVPITVQPSVASEVSMKIRMGMLGSVCSERMPELVKTKRTDAKTN